MQRGTKKCLELRDRFPRYIHSLTGQDMAPITFFRLVEDDEHFITAE